MAMGAVLYRVGTTKASELGGLHRYMPYTTIFCIIGGMSISVFRFLRFCRQVSDRLCSRSPGAGVCHLCAFLLALG